MVSYHYKNVVHPSTCTANMSIWSASTRWMSLSTWVQEHQMRANSLLSLALLQPLWLGAVNPGLLSHYRTHDGASTMNTLFHILNHTPQAEHKTCGIRWSHWAWQTGADPRARSDRPGQKNENRQAWTRHQMLVCCTYNGTGVYSLALTMEQHKFWVIWAQQESTQMAAKGEL